MYKFIKKCLQYSAFIPVIIVVLLFSIAYIAHITFGDGNIIEKVDEEILKDEFGVDVEFSK